MEKYYLVYVMINTPAGEYDQGCMADSLNEVMDDVLADHPSCTSVVMSVVRKLREEPMNDKANPTAPCDCPADMPTQLCVRYWRGECDGPVDTPANATPSELESEFRDGIPSSVTQPHAETVGDYFKRLYPEYYVQIITNINSEQGPEMAAYLLSRKAITSELHCAFIWYNSPEGHEFWKAVAQREA